MRGGSLLSILLRRRRRRLLLLRLLRRLLLLLWMLKAYIGGDTLLIEDLVPFILLGWEERLEILNCFGTFRGEVIRVWLWLRLLRRLGKTMHDVLNSIEEVSTSLSIVDAFKSSLIVQRRVFDDLHRHLFLHSFLIFPVPNLVHIGYVQRSHRS